MRQPLRAVFVPVLLGLVLALGLVHGSQPLELHQAASPGLYNEEHVLAALDTLSGDAPLPHVLGAIWLPVAAGVALFATALRPLATPLRHTDPRAPPLV